MHQSRLIVCSKGQRNECSTHLRDWIANLSNSDNGGHRLLPVFSLGDQSKATPQYKTPKS